MSGMRPIAVYVGEPRMIWKSYTLWEESRQSQNNQVITFNDM